MRNCFSGVCRDFIGRLRKNDSAKTAFTTFVSLLTGLAFMTYNGLLGILYGAAWNISISIYYAILSALRLYVLLSARKTAGNPECVKVRYRRKNFIVTYIILGFMDFALIAPVIDMALGHRNYTFGLIPAIAMATYTTYRIVTAVMHYRKSGKSNNIYILELRTFNLIDALAAILTLQNALIIANGGFDNGMRTLALYTSVGILLIMFGITTSSYRKARALCRNMS